MIQKMLFSRINSGTKVPVTNMKPKTTQYARILIGGAALMIASTAFADESIVKPEVIICFEGFQGIEPAEGEITDEEISVDEEIVDVEITDEETGSDEGEEIVINEEIIDHAEITDETDIVITWDPDWVKRNNDSENPEYLYMTAGGPALESQGQSTSTGPQAADEKSAVTMVDAKSVTTNISRAAAKPTAVKANGRVFLR